MYKNVRFLLFLVLLTVVGLQTEARAQGEKGYYRHAALHGDTVVFVAESDLWKVPVTGGQAVRLTTHHGYETRPAISPDGMSIAFNAEYEGPNELYWMPLAGGLPRRLTFDGQACAVSGFAPDGRILYATRAYCGLPDYQLALLDPASGATSLVPLAQGWEGSFSGSTLFFTRLSPQPSNTKRYRGGSAQNVWRFDTAGGDEARLLTGDFAGTSTTPMVWNNRVYFVSDRDGHMNLWSMTLEGKDLQQHTRHVGWDVQDPYLNAGRVVYQVGADLHLLDLTTGSETVLDITLGSDFDQTREKWIDDPVSWVSSFDLSPDGESVVFVSRGRAFAASRNHGRIVALDPGSTGRYRTAAFDFNGNRVLALGDASGEVEIWSLPVDGLGEAEQLTADAQILRWFMVPSPDSAWIAHYDKDQELWLLNRNTGDNQRIDISDQGGFYGLSWSPDGRWLAYTNNHINLNAQIWIYDTKTGSKTPVTSERYNSTNPQWDAEGSWLYFISDRHVHSLVRSVWGPRQPEPFFDRPDMIMMVALQPGLVSPFDPATELSLDGEKAEDDESEDAAVEIDLDGLMNRVYQVPVDPGNYTNLLAADGRLFWLSTPDRHSGDNNLMTIEVTNKDPEAKELAGAVRAIDLSDDGSKLMVRKGSTFYIVDAGGSADLSDKTKLDLAHWSFSITPRQEWGQMFVDAWRMHRDYFYDADMHGVDWDAMRAKYEPLVSRVSDRREFTDLIGQMVAELTALHSYVYGGDHRQAADNVASASLGARITRDTDAGGYRVEHVYASDPEEPWRASPLARPGSKVNAGDVIVSINGMPVLDAPSLKALLRDKTGEQVLLEVDRKESDEPDQVVVKPISSRDDAELRYHEWEYTRRLEVEAQGGEDLGYVHLRAMGGNDMDNFARNYYPVFKRKGLIIDARHNRGGNIESWILARLSRKPWMFWAPRKGVPWRNMQYGFIGHMVVLVDERTVSDGEVFAEGFRRLGLGKLIGVRTMGGEIWISSSNRMVDRGIAVAPEFGVYGPEGEWLIENHGVEPDIVVENPPYATFNGEDAQLQAAIRHLKELIASDPPVLPGIPDHPDKSSDDNRTRR